MDTVRASSRSNSNRNANRAASRLNCRSILTGTAVLLLGGNLEASGGLGVCASETVKFPKIATPVSKARYKKGVVFISMFLIAN
jgi:hypothetical protein